MNLLAWQFLFYGSMYAGTLAWHEKLFALLEGSAGRRVIVYVLFALVAGLNLGQKFGLWSEPPMVNKTTMAPVRLAHFVLTIFFLSSQLITFEAYLDRPISRLAALIGRETLFGFAASIPAFISPPPCDSVPIERT